MKIKSTFQKKWLKKCLFGASATVLSSSLFLSSTVDTHAAEQDVAQSSSSETVTQDGIATDFVPLKPSDKPGQLPMQDIEDNAEKPIESTGGNIGLERKFKNKDPFIFVHGFSGFVGDNAPMNMNYWGGNKYKLAHDLGHEGYEVHEASISAFGSNHDRAVELYYYIKGGRVDYGAAHAKKYGHARFGKTYKGVYPNWKPGQKVHLVGHSMGGQTIRLLEEYLRHGSPEERTFHEKTGKPISPLFEGNHDKMVKSITTIATPHDGTVVSDEVGNKDVIKHLLYEMAKFEGHRNSKLDFGLKQWGLEQREGENYIQYSKRADKSPIWKTNDTALYDLTREGAEKLNQKTTLNPNIYYRTFNGLATHEGPLGNHRVDPSVNIGHRLTGNIIGRYQDKAWRPSDGLVSVISALHPSDEAFKNVEAPDAPIKGIWQVTPSMQGFDHTDFTGQDALDKDRSNEELKDFYEGIVHNLMQTEKES
ncbi:YSIRK-targeted triacylglycerol lipase [Staphylococcus massiliensis]|uniref:YSIRK-targeted triacylglycerol lipase n=1 Tax=Staphylococcus massiliensis TaxID=555791 RepID=UPI001EE0C42D|nr:triacylglycerol lipase [Staphylococcus massiliensis]MCG3412811.1 triacylglycerol lipase [Staphylococcus massiliensis]